MPDPTRDSTWVPNSSFRERVKGFIAEEGWIVTESELTAHEVDTTNIHGIADTANLLNKASAFGGDLTGTFEAAVIAAEKITEGKIKKEAVGKEKLSAALQAELSAKANSSEIAEVDTDGTLAANSDAKVASQKATKTAIKESKRLIVRSRDLWKPEDVKVENFSRLSPTKNLAEVLTSGTLYVVGGLLLPEGEEYTTMHFHSATSPAVEPTHQWAVLIDINRKVLAISADKTTEAWGANTRKPFTFTKYTVPAGELQPVYAALLVTASIPPTLRGLEGENTFPGSLGKALAGFSNTGLTVPGGLTVGGEITALTAKNKMAYVTLN